MEVTKYVGGSVRRDAAGSLNGARDRRILSWKETPLFRYAETVNEFIMAA